MFALIPWDVWLAAALCIAILAAAIFEAPQIGIVLYLMLSAYIAVTTFCNNDSG